LEGKVENVHRWLRIGIVAVLLASVVAWAGNAHGVTAQGTVYTDTMEGTGTPLLSTESPDPSLYLYSYQNNQFIIETLQPGFSGDLLAFTSVPELTDSSVAVDFSIAGDLTGKYAFVGCRGGDQNVGYILEVHPDTGAVAMWRFDPDDSELLGSTSDTSVVTVGSGNNRIEIRCVGSTITGIVNGQQMLTAQDTTYPSGDSFIGTGKNKDTTAQLLTGFDNLTVTDLGAAPAQPTQAPVQPTQAPVQPTQAPAQPTQAPAQPTQSTGFPTAIPAQPTTAAGQPTTAAGTEGTTPITDPRVDPDGTLADAFIYSLMADPVGGPLQANDNLATGDFKYLSSGVQVSDFYAELYYVTPPAAPAGSWAVGFSFWDDGQGNSYDLFIQANNGTAKWGFGQSVNNSYSVLQSGELPAGAVDFTVGTENFLSLAVYQGVAMLSGNEFNLDTTVEVAATSGSGDVQAEVGFLATDTTTTQTLPVSLSDFAVWDISSGMVGDILAGETATPGAQPTQAAGLPTVVPAESPTVGAVSTVAPPPLESPTVASGSTTTGANALVTQIFNSEKTAAMAGTPLFSSTPGELVQQLDSFNIVASGSSVADFYATATFTNPTDLSTVSDYGIGFRDLNNNTEFRFVLGTDGLWGLSVGTAEPFVSGSVTNVNATPGGANTLEVLAKGSTGILVINGQVVQQVDLSANLNAGDVYIASGMVPSATVDQRVVPFSNFSVYQLPA
jgi:hypothetical protein